MGRTGQKMTYKLIVAIRTILMKSWEQMKELSYVGIKLTKAKSISEGLTRCKIDKLSRNNPVYEHLQLHKKYKDNTACSLCLPSHSPISFPLRPSTQPLHRREVKRSRAQEALPKQTNKKPLEKGQCSTPIFSRFFNKTLLQTPRQTARISANNFIKTISRFSQAMKRSRSNFQKMCVHQDHVEDYFTTAMDEIELQINEDRGHSLNQTRTDNKIMREELEAMRARRVQLERQAKQLKKPVDFPLTARQVAEIVREDLKVKKSCQKKLNQMVSSLYEYKSCKDYRNRLKTINSIVKK